MPLIYSFVFKNNCHGKPRLPLFTRRRRLSRSADGVAARKPWTGSTISMMGLVVRIRFVKFLVPSDSDVKEKHADCGEGIVIGLMC